MNKIVTLEVLPPVDDQLTEAEDENFKVLTAEEALRFRQSQPVLSVWPMWLGRGLAGVLVAALAWWWTGQRSAGESALYGALAVVVPAAVFARGMLRQRTAAHAGAALVGVFVWELVKIVLTVVMLFAAPRLILQLNWLALLAGFVVTMKMYWLVAGLQLARQLRSKKN